MNSNAVSDLSRGQSQGLHGGQPRRAFRSHYREQFSTLRAEAREARRAAQGDPDRLAKVQAEFKERLSDLKARAEANRAELRSRMEEQHAGVSGPNQPATEADSSHLNAVV